ncbi:MAG TPA: hypothetical protein ENI64_03445 [Gammaproteobacteria bacterium]|nr:hypothetical protein [Gammaproteobacteria bacterium]
MFIKKVIQTFADKDVKYAIVGGYAVALHGAIRGTIDIDLVITINKPQFIAAEQALLAIDLQPRLPVNADQIFDFREEYISNKNLVAWSFYNPVNPLEVVDILITHDLKSMNTITRKIGQFTIKVASIPDLIAMKKQAGRPQDIEDIKALEKLI